jgi:hypothetical protein
VSKIRSPSENYFFPGTFCCCGAGACGFFSGALLAGAAGCGFVGCFMFMFILLFGQRGIHFLATARIDSHRRSHFTPFFQKKKRFFERVKQGLENQPIITCEKDF